MQHSKRQVERTGEQERERKCTGPVSKEFQKRSTSVSKETMLVSQETEFVSKETDLVSKETILVFKEI